MRYLAIGLIAAGLCLAVLPPQGHAADLTWSLRGARVLMVGANPYTDPTLVSGNPYPFDAPLFYPLSALLIVLPLSFLPDPVAAAVFVGVSVALLSFVWRCHPALLGMLLSAPLLVSVVYAQWSPLLVAAAGVPWLGCLLTAKPAFGAALWGWQPSRRAALSAALIILLSLLIWPSWPLWWLVNVGMGRHVPPIVTVPWLAFVLLRWRDKRARLILLMALAPQFVGSSYDHLPLFLAMRSRRQGLILAAASWIGVLTDAWLGWEWALIVSTYGVALAVVLFSRSIRLTSCAR